MVGLIQHRNYLRKIDFIKNKSLLCLIVLELSSPRLWGSHWFSVRRGVLMASLRQRSTARGDGRDHLGSQQAEGAGLSRLLYPVLSWELHSENMARSDLQPPT